VTADHELVAGTALLGPADAGELLTLQLAAWVREARENATLEIPPLQEGLADVRAQLVDPALTIWGFRRERRLLATVRTSWLSDSTAFLGRLGVVPDLFGRGIGSAMLRWGETHLSPAVTRIELVTGIGSVSNHAFYARHGYEVISRDEVVGIVRLAKDR
jgi:ribosomal protein S18 acetylase RimI-like enzyme